MNSINTLYTVLLPFFILLLSYQIPISSQTTLNDPVMVIEVIRHGIRAPTTSDYDPFWKNLTGELLPQGMRQTYVLGKAVALQYPHLLSKYEPDEVYVRAINLNRTIMSAVSHLSGTFGPHYGHHLSKGQLKQVDVPYNYSSRVSERLKKHSLPHNFRIPAVHTAEFEHDYLLYAYSSKVCPISKELKEEQESSQYYLDYKEKMSSTITNLNELTGEEFGFHDISNFYSTLNIDHILNRKFPAPYDRIEVGSELWKNLTFIHNFNEFYGSFGGQLQVQLYSSLLLSEILELFQRNVNGTDTKFKYALYSGSDTLLMPLLHALGIASHECFADQFFNGTKHDLCMYPTFASNILFELHKGDKGDYYVKVKYNSKEANLCSTKDKKCEFNDFEDVIVTAVNGMTLEKYKQICGIPSHSKHHQYHHSKQKDSMVWYLPIAFSMVIFIIVISKIIHSKLKQMTKKNGISETLIKEYMIESLQV